MKISSSKSNIWIILALGFLVTTAFYIRQHNFVHSPSRSIDEAVYFRMGHQIRSGLQHYNANEMGQKLLDKNHPVVPAYFFKPIFKHPPLFTMFLASSFTLFGFNEIAAFYVPALFGLLMIPLIYALGALIYNRTVGLLSAAVLAVDPMSIICAQKVWMESQLAFFTVLCLYLAAKAIKQQRDALFIWSGVASGLSALTKYTGGIGTVIMIAYALIYDRKLLKNRAFLIGLAMPILLLTPWLLWNLAVYGSNYVGMQVELHSDKGHSLKFVRNIGLYILAGFAVLRLGKKFKEDLSPSAIQNIKLFASCAVAVIFMDSILKSFNILHLPITSWAGATFYGSSHTFYPDRLLEFSLIYFFAFLSFFIPLKDRPDEDRILRIGSIAILLFFTMWTAFQSRYIISANPLLIILGVNFLHELSRRAPEIPNLWARVVARGSLIMLLVAIFMKTIVVNVLVSFTNNFCYF